MIHLRRQLLLAGLAAVLAGCTGGDEFGRVAASGTLTVDGTPVPYARIQMSGQPNEKNQLARSTIHVLNGEFKVSADRGPAPGENTVTISLYDAAPQPSDDPDEGQVEGNLTGTWSGTRVVEAGKPLTFALTGDEIEPQ